jgi:hypothetical protein
MSAHTTVSGGASVSVAAGYPNWSASSLAQMPSAAGPTPGAVVNAPTAGSPLDPERVCPSSVASSVLSAA